MTTTTNSRPSPAPVSPVGWLGLLAIALVSASAVVLFVLGSPWGYAVLAAGLGCAALSGGPSATPQGALRDPPGGPYALLRSLLCVAVGLAALSSISLEADLSNAGMARFAVALSAAVVLPTLLARRLVARDAVVFPLRTGRPWSKAAWAYLIVVVVAGYLILPWYFLGSGAYLNWPPVATGNDIARLFVGVNAVGIWDELFFICIVFALYRRHLPLWLANILQAVVFVSFLWELGYQSWGPLLTIPFALVQGFTFALTKSLAYVVTVHLLFDAVVFMVLVHAHNPHLFDIFVTAPW